jgi:hypothetical protein
MVRLDSCWHWQSPGDTLRIHRMETGNFMSTDSPKIFPRICGSCSNHRDLPSFEGIDWQRLVVDRMVFTSRLRSFFAVMYC